jgi:cation diffusion facilitator family transporter
MDTQSLDLWKHDHAFLGAKHGSYEKRTWGVVALTTVMMVTEIGGGVLFGSIALVADGLHMLTHVAAMSIAALAYSYARRNIDNDWFSFGTGKLGDLAGFGSAIILAMVAVLIGYESIVRLIHPVQIDYREAIPLAVLGLAVNLVSAFLLHDHHDHEPVDRDFRHHSANVPDDHDHDHGHEHAHHADFNIRAAYAHVVADAVTSLLAIAALTAAAYFGLPWLDPTAGFIGTIVITIWAYSLIKSAGAVLLDAVPSREHAALIRSRLEADGDRVADFHLWRLGPGHLGVLAVVVSDKPRPPAHYKAKLADIEGLSHVNIEVNSYHNQIDCGSHSTGGTPNSLL